MARPPNARVTRPTQWEPRTLVLSVAGAVSLGAETRCRLVFLPTACLPEEFLRRTTADYAKARAVRLLHCQYSSQNPTGVLQGNNGGTAVVQSAELWGNIYICLTDY